MIFSLHYISADFFDFQIFDASTFHARADAIDAAISFIFIDYAAITPFSQIRRFDASHFDRLAIFFIAD
jgi:hypothetical protein